VSSCLYFSIHSSFVRRSFSFALVLTGGGTTSSSASSEDFRVPVTSSIVS
jgi:hypothetical protein